MVKVTGFDSFSKTLDEAQTAMRAIDGEIGKVSFDPSEAGSIERAVQEMENMMDRLLGEYAQNPIVAPMIYAMKERYRDAIIERAAEARLGEDSHG